MSSQSIYSIDNVLESVDRFLACRADSYLRWIKYKVGKKPDMKKMNIIMKLRDIVAFDESQTSLCPDELEAVKEKLNKLIT